MDRQREDVVRFRNGLLYLMMNITLLIIIFSKLVSPLPISFTGGLNSHDTTSLLLMWGKICGTMIAIDILYLVRSE